jgi:hemoglobin
MLDPSASLYERLGGYDGVAAIVDDLLPRLHGDPSLAVYWKGKCKDSLKKDRQLLVDFLGAAFGGPVVYLGRTMKMSHEGLGITDEEWRRFIEHVTATLRNQAIPEREANEFLAAAEGLKAEVVETSRMAIAHGRT